MLTITDRDRFINDGPFFEKYPDIYPDVTRYEHFDQKGKIIESWERDDNGRMHDVTKRDQLREKLIAEQEAARREIKRLEDKCNAQM